MTKRNDEEPPPFTSKTSTATQSTYSPFSLKRRYPLPDSFSFETHDDNDYILYGYINSTSSDNQAESSDKNSHCDQVLVELLNLKQWMFEKSNSYRGVWVKTPSAWYYLKEPCHVAVPRITHYFESDQNGSMSSQKNGNDDKSSSSTPKQVSKDPYLPSQASLFVRLRAKLCLLSNILDIFSEKKGDNEFHYAPLHSKHGVHECHKMLALNTNFLKTKYQHLQPPIIDEPFDMDLLKQKGVAKFIREQLRNYHLALTDECMFLKSLLEIDTPSGTTKNEWRDKEYRQSATKAEKRGQNHPWFEPLPEKEYRPNRLIELEIENNDAENTMDGNEMETQEKLVEGTAAKILGVDTNHVFVMTENPAFDEASMRESMENLDYYLLPKLTDDDKEKCDYKKFSIDESKVEDFLRKHVINHALLSLESMLLIVITISNSSGKVMKSLFRVSGPDESNMKTAGTIVFKFWLSYNIRVMEERRHRFSKIKPQLEEIRTEELVVAKILELISHFHVIKTLKQINTLKEKYGIDWFDSVQKVSA